MSYKYFEFIEFFQKQILITYSCVQLRFLAVASQSLVLFWKLSQLGDGAGPRGRRVGRSPTHLFSSHEKCFIYIEILELHAASAALQSQLLHRSLLRFALLRSEYLNKECINDHFWPRVTSNEVGNSVNVFRMSNYQDLIPHMPYLQLFYDRTNNTAILEPFLALKWPKKRPKI